MNKAIWLTYDLGVQGDYPGLYEFLDSYKAKDCGESCAFLEFPVRKTLLPELNRALKKQVSLKKGDRIYVIYRTDTPDKRLKGRFLSGGRKGQPPWAGYATADSTAEDSDG